MFDFFNYSIQSVYAFSLVFVRIGALCVVSPIYGGEQIPKRIRTLFALFFAFVIFPTLSLQISELPVSPFHYLFIVTNEIALGLMIGFLATAIFYGFQLGGSYIAIHMGMNMGQTLDPFSSEQTSVIGQIFNLIVIAVFLVTNGHHFILKAIQQSFVLIPPTQVIFNQMVLDQAIKTFNVVIWTSLKIALPTMAALFALNLVFGFIARLVPKMNVFIISLPAKISAGIVIVVAALPAVIYLFLTVVEKVFSDISVILRLFS